MHSNQKRYSTVRPVLKANRDRKKDKGPLGGTKSRANVNRVSDKEKRDFDIALSSMMYHDGDSSSDDVGWAFDEEDENMKPAAGGSIYVKKEEEEEPAAVLTYHPAAAVNGDRTAQRSLQKATSSKMARALDRIRQQQQQILHMC
jgi:hypothetical protein